MNTPLVAEEIIEILGLEPLPEEGGRYRQSYRDEHSSAIWFLLERDDFSAMHLLTGAEVYHWYAGDPVELLLLHPDGSGRTALLGPQLRAGQRPQLVVPGGVWQGSFSCGNWSLLGTTMAPGFTWNDFTLGGRAELQRRYPDFAAQIELLTR